MPCIQGALFRSIGVLARTPPMSARPLTAGNVAGRPRSRRAFLSGSGEIDHLLFLSCPDPGATQAIPVRFPKPNHSSGIIYLPLGRRQCLALNAILLALSAPRSISHSVFHSIARHPTNWSGHPRADTGFGSNDRPTTTCFTLSHRSNDLHRPVCYRYHMPLQNLGECDHLGASHILDPDLSNIGT